MKLDDLRRKAVSGIKPNRKVEKTLSLSAPIIEITCFQCKQRFSNIATLIQSIRCPSCGQIHDLYFCVAGGCRNLVTTKGTYCEHCCRNGIPIGLVMQFSGKEVKR